MPTTSTPVLHGENTPDAPVPGTTEPLVGIHVGDMIDVLAHPGVGFGAPAAYRSIAKIVQRVAPMRPTVVIAGSGEFTGLIAQALADADVPVVMRRELPRYCIDKPWIRTEPGDRAAMVLSDYVVASVAARRGAESADTDRPVQTASPGQPTSSQGEAPTKSHSRAFDVGWFLAITAIQFVPFFLIAWWMSASAGSAFWWASALAPLSSINLEFIGRGWPSLFELARGVLDVGEMVFQAVVAIAGIFSS